jgi:hypothetical protein
MKTVVVETLDHRDSLGSRQNGNRGAPFVRNNQCRPRKRGCSRGIVTPMPL